MLNIDLCEVFRALGQDLGIPHRDVMYAAARIQNEGVGFATTTLPIFSKTILASLEAGHSLFRDNDVTSFVYKNKSAVAPVFLSGYTSMIFTDSGLVSDNKEAVGNALRVIRQFCEYVYKLALPFTDEALASAERDFCELDDQVKKVSDVDTVFLRDLRLEARNLLKSSVDDDPSWVFSHYNPRPGSGTYSADDQHQWYDQIYRPFTEKPLWLNMFTRALRALSDRRSASRNYSEVLFVPKDSRGPRTIVREPRDNIYHQMAFHDYAKDVLAKRSHGRIQFVDQSGNQILAYTSSIDKSLATLDLKNASDLVSNSIVKEVFYDWIPFRFFHRNFRTYRTKLPSGAFRALNKLSGMGSGFTFPCMAALIYLVVSYTVRKYTYENYAEVMSKVRVYGDDLIIPVAFVPHVTKYLEHIGLRVNRDKSYLHSHFRESCGKDYYAGIDVTPLRLKLSSCIERSTSSFITFKEKDWQYGLYVLNKHANLLGFHGFHSLQLLYEGIIHKRFRHFPFSGNIEAPGLIRYREGYTYLSPISLVAKVPLKPRLSHIATGFCDMSGNLRDMKVYDYIPRSYDSLKNNETYRYMVALHSESQAGIFNTTQSCVGCHTVYSIDGVCEPVEVSPSIPRLGSLRVRTIPTWVLCDQGD